MAIEGGFDQEAALKALEESIAQQPLPAPGKEDPKFAKSILKRFGLETGAWILGQREFRARAMKKSSTYGARMLGSRVRSEMGTVEPVAWFHAAKFPNGATVVDLTAGVGFDALVFAERGPVTALEYHEETFGYLSANAALARHPLTALQGDSLAFDANDVPFVYADPMRRGEGEWGGEVQTIRKANLDNYEPDPRVLVERFASVELGLLKLSPLLFDAELDLLGPTRSFVSFGGECREVLVEWGRSAGRGVYAVHVESGQVAPSAEVTGSLTECGAFLYDADPALVRAHALGQWEELSELGDSVGYLTGDAEIDSPWLRAYRVLYDGRGDAKTTKIALRSLGRRVEEVKKRHAKGIDSDALMRAVRWSPEKSLPVCSLVVYAVGKSFRHALVERL